MCQALQELMKDEIDEQINNAVNDAVNNKETEVQLVNIRAIMKNFKYTAEQAMDALNIPEQNRGTYMAKL